MQLSKPHTYQIAWDSSGSSPRVVKSENGKAHFSCPVTKEQRPKLYVISHSKRPLYVGKTTDPIASRLWDGFNPSGHNGYKGYLWRQNLKLSPATIDIWMLTLNHQDTIDLVEDPSMKRARENNDQRRIEEVIIETLEAEVVLLFRQNYGNWPEYQSEIHFHQAQDLHRQKAWEIVSHYRSTSCPTA